MRGRRGDRTLRRGHEGEMRKKRRQDMEERGRGKVLKEGALESWGIGGMDRAWNEGMEGGEVTGRSGRRSR